MVAGFKDHGTYYYDQFEVGTQFHLAFLVPETVGKTDVLRRVLPSEISYGQCISNLSRIVHLPKTLQEGTLKKLKAVLQDQLHEQYRFSYIPLSDKLLELSKNPNIIVKISGSGPAILIISDTNPKSLIPTEILTQFTYHEFEIGNHIKIEIEA